MGDIKNVIGVLCKHLNCLLDSDLKPEHFRLAKFNKCDDGVVKLFWSILSKLVNSNGEDLVNNTKLYFCQNNYECLSFYSLPEDMSYGSRELLLALSFIISKGALKKLILQELKASPFNHEYNIISDCCTSEQNIINIKGLKNEDDFRNALDWIDGKFCHNTKMIHEYSASIQKLAQKLQEKSDIFVKLGDLSVSQILALHDEELCKIFLEESSRIMKILENHDKWLKVENVFWKWMTTVLTERNTHKITIRDDILENFYTHLHLLTK